MAITDNESAFVDATAVSIGLSQIFTVTADASDPAYLVLTVLDRNEYTAGASSATGTLTGNGQTLSLGSISGDGRGTGIVFTYQAATGRYYNPTYGYLDQLVYNSSSSAGDMTSLSLFGTSSLALANAYAANAMTMMEVDAAGYLGSATVVTQPGYTGTVPTQATPDSIAATADSFVGQAWNMNGCWVLASTIAADAGASLPVQSTAIGLAGEPNGEWIVAYNGPAGQTGNWQSMVTAGEMVVFQTTSGDGHITTCVSGSGSTAMLVDNITYVNGSGQIINPANDGSSSDIIIAAPHAASQEFAGVSASTVVIYELDTPVVTATVASDALAALASQSVGSLFTAMDPANNPIASWQVFDTASTDWLVLNGIDYSGLSVANALTVSSLASVSLVAGSATTTDTLEVRAYNGSYWGDWTALNVAISGTVASPPVLEAQTANQTWTAGQAVTLALAAGTFLDPQGAALTYAATLSGGQALPSWLTFNAATDTFTGAAPGKAQTISFQVTATDTAGLSASETFAATVIAAPVVTTQIANQSWTEGKSYSFSVPAGTFTDPQGESLAYTAALQGGQALPSWLQFNAATDTFSGTAPTTAQTVNVTVTATDTSGLSASDTFAIAVAGLGPVLTNQTANQTWKEGQSLSLKLPSNAFTDQAGLKMSYSATLANGQALPSWLKFNASSETFSGTPPNTAEALSITVTAKDTSGAAATDTFSATVLGTPAVTAQTASQTWTEGQAFFLTLPANTFTDPQGESLTCTATLSNGQALPSWLRFNAATDTFSGTAPASAQSVNIQVTANDTAGLSVSETFKATVQAASTPGHVGDISITDPTPAEGITVTNAAPTGGIVDGSTFSLALAPNTFTDALGLNMTFAAYQASGPDVASWLHFNPATDTFAGTAPGATTGTAVLAVVASDPLGMSAEDLFSVSFSSPGASGHMAATVSLLGAAQQVDPSQLASMLAIPN